MDHANVHFFAGPALPPFIIVDDERWDWSAWVVGAPPVRAKMARPIPTFEQRALVAHAVAAEAIHGCHDDLTSVIALQMAIDPNPKISVFVVRKVGVHDDIGPSVPGLTNAEQRADVTKSVCAGPFASTADFQVIEVDPNMQIGRAHV